MPNMTSSQLKYFNAVSGAFSYLTKREAVNDRSTTLDKYEKAVFFEYYALNDIRRLGGAPSNGMPKKKKFNIINALAPSMEASNSLSVVHPKKNKNELRLYMNKSSGFEGRQGDAFFIFKKNGSLVPSVGFLSRPLWDRLFSDDGVMWIDENDDDDINYQNDVNNLLAKLPIRKSGLKYSRSIGRALKAIKSSGYNCELDNSHKSFISEASNMKYLEAHHLVPLSAQKGFKFSLDVVENIVSLCSECHRRIHFEKLNQRSLLLNNIFNKRKVLLARKKIEIENTALLKLYGM